LEVFRSERFTWSFGSYDFERFAVEQGQRSRFAARIILYPR
jgi:hypothetical protein